MNGIVTRRWGLVAAIVSMVALMAASGPAQATTKPLPPQSHAYGKTYAQWSAAWWTWIWESPAIDVNGNNTNPNLDATGAYTLAGQENNHVIFLAGAFWGDNVRTITIQTGHPLFFPIANVFSDNTPPDQDSTIAMLQDKNKVIVDSFVPADLYATLNGVSLVTTAQLPAFRAQSPAFEYVLPEINLWGLPPGPVDKAVSDGYWLMLPPLGPGQYDLAFGYSGWGLNVTYHITVAPAE
jgi:hypothetical protein